MTAAHELLEALVRINSVNPDLVAGAPGEGDIAAFIAGWLLERDFEVRTLEPAPGRVTVVGVARGTGGGKTLMFNGHLDTVALQPFDGDPLEPRVENGRLYARGSYDMKAGLAAMLIAAARAKQMVLRGDLLVACVCDEEVASLGSFDLTKHFSADAAIVTEPTDHALFVAHKGFVWATITTHGVAAHGSRFDLGVDAITKMGQVLVAVAALDQRLRAQPLLPPHPLLGHGSLHAGTIAGGQGYSSYPESCRLQIERRTVPGETPEGVEAELRELLEGLASRDPNFKYSLEMGLSREPFSIDPNHPFVQLVQRQAQATLPEPPALRGVSFWADTAALSAAGIPCLMFGALGAGAHGAEEWVDLNSFELTAQIYENIIEEFCA